MNKLLLIGAAAAALIAAPSQAALLGDSISGQYFFPTTGSPYGGFSITSNPFTVGAGSEATFFVDGNPIDIDFSDTQLVLTLPSVGFTSASFNGIIFTNLTDAFSPITSFSGATASLNSGLLQINWQGQSFSKGDKVIVNFGAAPAVPEASTWAMMIAGFGAVGFAMRRRQKVALSFA